MRQDSTLTVLFASTLPTDYLLHTLKNQMYLQRQG